MLTSSRPASQVILLTSTVLVALASGVSGYGNSYHRRAYDSHLRFPNMQESYIRDYHRLAEELSKAADPVQESNDALNNLPIVEPPSAGNQVVEPSNLLPIVEPPSAINQEVEATNPLNNLPIVEPPSAVNQVVEPSNLLPIVEPPSAINQVVPEPTNPLNNLLPAVEPPKPSNQVQESHTPYNYLLHLIETSKTNNEMPKFYIPRTYLREILDTLHKYNQVPVYGKPDFRHIQAIFLQTDPAAGRDLKRGMEPCFLKVCPTKGTPKTPKQYRYLN